MPKKVETPILDSLLASGVIYVLDGDTYVGRASDGVEVAIGSTFTPTVVESYLTVHPTPESW